MTKLLWDQVGDRTYEAGVDRGVLYLEDGSGVPWVGLTGVDEEFGNDDVTPNYLDGVKASDLPGFGDFSGKLTAFTYPDEFLEYEGSLFLADGMYVGNQQTKTFGLSYRTLIGNDVDGIDHGYKLHILYNLTAAPSNDSHETLANDVNPMDFSWTLLSIPETISDYRPTAHIILDSTEIEPSMLQGLEQILYGGIHADARLPSAEELVSLGLHWVSKVIFPHPDTGIADLVDGVGDLNEVSPRGVYTPLPNTRLNETATSGIYQLIT